MNNLDILTNSLKISDVTKEASLFGLIKLSDFNTLDLNDFTRIFDNYTDEVKEETIEVMKSMALEAYTN